MAHRNQVRKCNTDNRSKPNTVVLLRRDDEGGVEMNQFPDDREVATASVPQESGDNRRRRKRKYEDPMDEQSLILRRSSRSKKPKKDDIFVYN